MRKSVRGDFYRVKAQAEEHSHSSLYVVTTRQKAAQESKISLFACSCAYMFVIMPRKDSIVLLIRFRSLVPVLCLCPVL